MIPYLNNPPEEPIINLIPYLINPSEQRSLDLISCLNNRSKLNCAGHLVCKQVAYVLVSELLLELAEVELASLRAA